MMTGFMLPYDALEEYQGLTDEQFGKLIRAGLRYARDGEETELSAPESYLYPGLKIKIARDKEKYQEKCRKNRENIAHRWGNPPPGDDTTVYDRIRTYTNDTNNNININPNINNQSQYQSINHQEQARKVLRAEGYTESEIAWAIAKAGNGQGVRDWTKYLRQTIENERRQKKPVQAQDYNQREYPEREETPEQQIARLRDEMNGGGGE